MKNFLPSAKIVASTALIALTLNVAPHSALAQSVGNSSSSFLDSTTNLRTIRKQTTSFNSTSGAPSTPYQGNPGCNQTIMQSMQDSANFTASQSTAVHVNTLQMPSSFSSCMTGLIKNFQSQNNAFKQQGAVNISAIFTNLLDAQINGMVTSLEQTACSRASAAVKSATGTIGSVERDFSQFGKGGPIMSSAPGTSSSSGFVGP